MRVGVERENARGALAESTSSGDVLKSGGVLKSGMKLVSNRPAGQTAMATSS